MSFLVLHSIREHTNHFNTYKCAEHRVSQRWSAAQVPSSSCHSDLRFARKSSAAVICVHYRNSLGWSSSVALWSQHSHAWALSKRRLLADRHSDSTSLSRCRLPQWIGRGYLAAPPACLSYIPDWASHSGFQRPSARPSIPSGRPHRTSANHTCARHPR